MSEVVSKRVTRRYLWGACGGFLIGILLSWLATKSSFLFVALGAAPWWLYDVIYDALAPRDWIWYPFVGVYFAAVGYSVVRIHVATQRNLYRVGALLLMIAAHLGLSSLGMRRYFAESLQDLKPLPAPRGLFESPRGVVLMRCPVCGGAPKSESV